MKVRGGLTLSLLLFSNINESILSFKTLHKILCMAAYKIIMNNCQLHYGVDFSADDDKL
jgi:hypothetical protein